jgi:hypothetical protein
MTALIKRGGHPALWSLHQLAEQDTSEIGSSPLQALKLRPV